MLRKPEVPVTAPNPVPNSRIVRIGGASGAWGDSPLAIGQLLQGPVDYLMMDYLAEVTMSLLARARIKDPGAGYPPDFVACLKPHLAEILRRGIRVVTNAGGVNPAGCKAALEAVCAELGLSARIAVVQGDDLIPHLPALRPLDPRDMATGAPMPDRLLTANAYLGALPIRAALGMRAQIVITGRCADSALALGALMHEFGWDAEDYDRLAAGSLVGHVLECGPQATGGIHSDWDSVPDWADIGYPLAECRRDGSFVVTKPDGTGGMVTPAVVAEQILYEVGDPAAYLLPDVVADFSAVQVAPQGPDRVLVQGARGRAPGPDYKVSATWQDGYRATALISIVGPEAPAKARRTGTELLARAARLFARHGLAAFTDTRIEVLGAESAYPAAARAATPREVVLRLVMLHPDRRALEMIAREVGSIGLGFAPGTTGLLGGRPRPAPQVRLFSFLVARSALPPPSVTLADNPPVPVALPATPTGTPAAPAADAAPGPGQLAPGPSQLAPGPWVTVPLKALAWSRSGDKGDGANIAIIARAPAFLPHLRAWLTPARMLAHFGDLVAGPADRYEAPGLNALNFLLHGALGGGGMASLRIDPLGKAFGQMALELPLPAPQAWIDAGLLAARWSRGPWPESGTPPTEAPAEPHAEPPAATVPPGQP